MFSTLKRFESKKAFKLYASVAIGHEMILHDPSLFTRNEYPSLIEASAHGYVNVVGPSEYERTWFATVKRGKAGQIVVS